MASNPPINFGHNINQYGDINVQYKRSSILTSVDGLRPVINVLQSSVLVPPVCISNKNVGYYTQVQNQNYSIPTMRLSSVNQRPKGFFSKRGGLKYV